MEREHQILTLNNLISSLTIMMWAPFVMYYLSAVLHYSERIAALVTGGSTMVQFFGMALLGSVVDRMGGKRALRLGLTIRVCVFSGLSALEEGWIHTHWVIPAIMMNAVAVAFINPAIRRVIGSVGSQRSRAQALTLFFATSNLGTVLGPMLGSVFLVQSPKLTFMAMAFIFALLWGLTFFLGEEANTKTSREHFTFHALKHLWHKNRHKIIATSFSSFSFFLFYGAFFRNYLLIYLQAFWEKAQEGYGLMMAFYAVLTLLFQLGLSGVLLRVTTERTYAVGFLLLALALFGFGTHQKLWVYCGLVALALGEILTYVKSEIEIGNIDHRYTSTLIGFSRFFWGLTGLINVFLGLLFQGLKASGRLELFWVLGGVLSLLSMLVFLYQGRRKGKRQKSVPLVDLPE